MDRKTKIKIFKIIIMILVIALLIGITIYLFPVIKNLMNLDFLEC